MNKQKREFNTVEEFREYQRKISREWYKRNREKKIEYQKKRYYDMINSLKEKELEKDCQ